ncbi:hypothetical protein [Salmonella sp. s51228]|uniref:hypothetical protein n=1 Tax=Salmonella sp. s51228 TaxID=3159652 RepID=UPI0039815666
MEKVALIKAGVSELALKKAGIFNMEATYVLVVFLGALEGFLVGLATGFLAGGVFLGVGFAMAVTFFIGFLAAEVGFLTGFLTVFLAGGAFVVTVVFFFV